MKTIKKTFCDVVEMSDYQKSEINGGLLLPIIFPVIIIVTPVIDKILENEKIKEIIETLI